MDPAQALHRRSLFLMLLAACCWSTSGLFVRSVQVASGWELVFWRSLGGALFVATMLAVLRRRALVPALRSVGRHGFLASIFLACQFTFFLMAIAHTTVANASALMSVSPLVSALAGLFFLHERIAPRTWIALAVAVGGMAVMFTGALRFDDVLGGVFALLVCVFFAAQVTMLRRAHASTDLLPTVLFATVWTTALAGLVAGPFRTSGHDIAVLLAMGCFQLGTGCLLMTAASRHLKAAEVGLMQMLESILAPLWVWLAFGEQPGSAALAGGAIVLAAVFGNEIVAAGLRPSRTGSTGTAAVRE